MVTITPYKTFADYPDADGFYKILYPVRDAISVMNPFFVILMGFLLVATTASYYTYALFTGRDRFFNCLLASSFGTFMVSIFFAMGELVNPYTPLLFISTTIISLSLAIFYR